MAVQAVGNHSIDSDTTSLLLSTLGSVLRRRLADEVHALTGNSRRLQSSWGDFNSLLDAVNDVAVSFGMSSVNGESQNVNEPNVDGVVIQTQVSTLLLLLGLCGSCCNFEPSTKQISFGYCGNGIHDKG